LKKAIIIGAGPAGLTAAWEMLAPTWTVFFIFIGAIIDFFIKYFSASV
jgi:thioredoxin reductase